MGLSQYILFGYSACERSLSILKLTFTFLIFLYLHLGANHMSTSHHVLPIKAKRNALLKYYLICGRT